MARKKQNIEAFGKSWSPIDIPNLEKAVRLYERLNYLQDHFANSLSGSSKIMAYINEQGEVKQKLDELAIKATEKECRQLLAMFEAQKKAAEAEKKRKETASENAELYNNILKNSSEYKAPTTIKNMLDNAGNRYIQNKMKNEVSQALNTAVREANKKGMTKGTDEYNRFVTETANASLKGVSDKFAKGATAIQLAANTFSFAVNKFSGLFFDGLNKQARIYEETYTNISVRTGITRGKYFANQTATAANLYSSGLAGNIATSDVQDMWNKLANIGMNQEDMFTRALDNVLTNKIVPYLDTTSSSLNILNERVDGRFVRDIRGINKINNEIAGNNFATQELLNTIIDEMQPMSDAALEQLAQGSAEVTALVNKLAPSMGLDAAKSYATQLFKAQKYSDQVLRSGSLTEQKTLIDAIGNGVNIYDPTQYNDYMVLGAKNTQMFANMGPGYTNTLNGLIMNTIGGTVGETSNRLMGIGNLKESLDSIKNLTDLTPEEIAAASNEVTKDYTNNVNNTLKQIQSNELENASTWLAAIYEQIGYWGDIAANLLKGIGIALGAKMLVGAGKSLLGLGKKGAAAAGGLVGAGLTSFANTGVGYAMMGTGASLGINSIPLATAAGLATTATGVAGAGYGAYKTFQYGSQAVKSGKAADWGATATAGASTAAFAGGTIAALAGSGPVGWALMAVGAIGLVAADLIEDLGHDGDIMEELNDATKKRVADFEEAHYKERKQLQEFRDNISELDDVNEIQKQLIQSGIATQEELQEAMYDDKDALIALTDQFIASKASLDKTGEGLLREIENSQNKQQNQISKDIWDLSKKSLGDMTKEEKAVMGDFMEDYYYWMKALADSGDKDAKYRIDEWEKYGNNLTDHIVSQDDLNAINSLNTWHYGDNDDTYDLYKKFMADADNVQSITRSTNLQNYLGLDKSFNKGEYSQAIDYIEKALLSKNDEDTKSMLSKAKALGLTWEVLGQYDSGKTYQQKLREKGIESYRTGLDYVPYDDYLANLHEGEAVITASTATELRNLITTYRETQQTSVNLDTIINNQTVALVNKLDEVISSIETINTATTSGSSTKAMLENMKYLRSTKSFNS